jgi:rubrerythrin
MLLRLVSPSTRIHIPDTDMHLGDKAYEAQLKLQKDVLDQKIEEMERQEIRLREASKKSRAPKNRRQHWWQERWRCLGCGNKTHASKEWTCGKCGMMQRNVGY